MEFHLPKSGIGVDGPFLVIAPANNPAIRLDARVLDIVDVGKRSPVAPLLVSVGSTAGIVASAMTLIPGWMIASAGLGYLAYDRFAEARRRVKNRDLRLGLGDLEVALHVVDGPEGAKQIADRLSGYTRTAPITRADVYEDACRRLRRDDRGDAQQPLVPSLFVGSDFVEVSGSCLRVGQVRFPISQVQDYAIRGANLPLPGGQRLQAAMGLLVVAAQQRLADGEDMDALTERIAAYEQWSGRRAGR